ncbi:MAG TPA: TonB-dependent receptor, partial [Povalibacter sp.]|nr:TonB-dependent receptor [Povalibacter sp.]
SEVVVTGSRIHRQDFEASSPVLTVSSDAFKLSGETQVETVLNSLPQLVPAITTTSNNPSNGGQANVDLRGLGSTRTLVLMDGARLPPSNVNGVVDLNTVPSALIESVEILTGGASSTYGSDAIAGVVNIRTKRNFDGIEVSLQHNMTSENDGQTSLAEATAGTNFAGGRGNAVLSLAYDRREEVLAGDRPFGVVARGPTLAPSGSGTIPGGRIDWGTNQPSAAAMNQVFAAYGAAAGAVTRATPVGFNPDHSLFSIGIANNPADVVHYLGDTSDPGFNPDVYSYNFGPVNYLQLPLERRQAAIMGHFEMTPGTEVYTRLMYTKYHADQQLAATPVTCSGAALGCVIPINAATRAIMTPELLTLVDSRNTPGGNLNFTTRTTEVGPRAQENDYDVMQGLLGFRGDFTVRGDTWHWDVFGSMGRSDGTSLQDGNVSRSRLQAALNNPTVYAADGCNSFNPYGEGNITPECADAIGILASNELVFKQTNFVGSLTGSLLKLPAGGLDFAVGAEYREESADFKPDQALATGDVVGFNAQQPVEGKIKVTEPFAELSVPLLADKPGANYLGLELGYRYSDYNIAGAHSTYKAALQWKPFESVQVRGSYNRAIRAPNIQDLFLPRQENFAQYTDPCNVTSAFRYGTGGVPGGTGGATDGPNPAAVEALCVAQGIPQSSISAFQQLNSQARAFVGGNLELVPEEADTYTLGVTWQSNASSDWLHSLSTSVDYFRYDIENVITSLTASSILGRCFNQLGTNPDYDPNFGSCQLFTRNPNNFAVTDVVTTQLNLSARKVDGIDLNFDWSVPLSVVGLENGGDLGFKLLVTRLLSWEQQETIEDPFLDRAGTIGQTVASAYPEWKGVLSTTYSWGPLQFRYNLRYISGMDVVNNDALLTPSTSAVPVVDTYLYHDFTGKWNINDMFGVTLGVTNIGDKQPPVYTTNAQAGIQSNTDPSTYDVLGRRYFLNLTAKF